MDKVLGVLAVAAAAAVWLTMVRGNRRRARGEVTAVDTFASGLLTRDADAPGHHLLTADEVGEALGYPVVEHHANAGVLGADVQQFEDVAYNNTVATLALMRGMTAEVGIRSARDQADPLPGVGDEGWQGPGWALTRVGDVHLRLTTASHRPVDQARVVDLLRAAAARR